MTTSTPVPRVPELPNDERSNLNDVIRRNISTIVRLRLQAEENRTIANRIADSITHFSGRMLFVGFHVIWFTAWFILNSAWFGFKPFDPFPYGLLTMVVSLEAIFLSTFVLISQNRMGQTAEERADLDLQINLLTEYELTRVLQMLDEIQDKLGIENDHDMELQQLEAETKPEDVLNEIERYQQLWLNKRK